MIIICDFWIMVGSLLDCILKIGFDQHEVCVCKKDCSCSVFLFLILSAFTGYYTGVCFEIPGY